MAYTIQEATAERWADVEQVMGANGAYGGCWCSFWRLTNQQTQGRAAEENHDMLQALVASDAPAGLLLYAGAGEKAEPIGWCSLAPRPAFPRLFHTNGLELDDPNDSSVWSVVCIYVRREHRGTGAASALLDAAVAYACERGAAVLEGYPVADPSKGRKSGLATGTISHFARAGFTGEGRPATGRRIVMRRTL